MDDAYTKNDVFHIVFCVVLLSIGVQGSLLPLISRRLHMIDNSQDVMKTFNDYAEESSLQFVALTLEKGHEWIGRQIQSIILPPQMRIAYIRRGEEQVIPRGSTILEEEDILIMSAVEYQGSRPIAMKEVYVDKKHKWNNRQLNELELPHSRIVLIKRKGHSFAPTGESRIVEGDMLVLIGDEI